jgi:hypothetical protein
MSDESQIENPKPKTEGSRKGIGGPKTPQGRRRVSLNAIEHGYYAKTEAAMEILAERVGRDYKDLHEELRAYFKPRDPLEELLVRRISRAAWRTLLTEAVENTELVKFGGMPGLTHCYGDMIRNERFIDIQLHRALFALERKRCSEKKLQNKLSLLPIHEGARS